MKNRLNFVALKSLMLMLLGLAYRSNAQAPCGMDAHAVFANSSSDVPVLLKKLGTSPQFGEISKHTSNGAYIHLRKVHAKDIRNSRSEIDDFLKGLGYSGFNDPEFGSNKITPEILPAGTIGWMGAYARGHKYRWSVLGRDFETFRIVSKDRSCFAFIMKKCGNAFYDPRAREAAENAARSLAVSPQTKCVTQTINFKGKSQILASDVLNTTQNLPVVASFNGNNLCLGDFNVPVRVTYEMTAFGEIDYAKAVKVCDYGNGVSPSSTVNLPLALKYSLSNSDVSIGDDGKLVMAVNAQQFKVLKKVYKACPSSSETSNSKTTELIKVNTSSEGSTSSSVGETGTANCLKQTINLNGSATIKDVSTKIATNEVTLIGIYDKVGKLQKGETAKKYLCLGSYNVPTKSNLQYALNGTSTMKHIVEVCNNGNANQNENVSVPLKLKNDFGKQETMVGDYGKIYMPLTKVQYKKLNKRFKRCCSNGRIGSKCY